MIMIDIIADNTKLLKLCIEGDQNASLIADDEKMKEHVLTLKQFLPHENSLVGEFLT